MAESMNCGRCGDPVFWESPEGGFWEESTNCEKCGVLCHLVITENEPSKAEMVTEDGLECAHCSASALFPFDDNGFAWEGWEQVCHECFHRNEVEADGEFASSHADDECLDIGQPRCNGSCGSCKKWVAEGHPCGHACNRLSLNDREKIEAAAAKFNAEHPLTPGDPEEQSSRHRCGARSAVLPRNQAAVGRREHRIPRDLEGDEYVDIA